jgi:hypothetical protein
MVGDSEYDMSLIDKLTLPAPQSRLDNLAYASNLTRGHNQARLIRRMNRVSYKQKFIAWTDSEENEEEAFFSD